MRTAEIEVVRRLEAAVAACAAESARATPGASLERIAGGWALFSGAESPLSHAVGIGANGPVSAEELDRLERFYQERGAAAAMDVAALADPSLFAMLIQRKYAFAELGYTLVRDMAAPIELPVAPDIRVEADADPQLWARVVAQGFSGLEDPPEEMLGLLSGESGALHRFLAYAGDEAIAGAAMSVTEGVAWLTGDSTRVAARNRGAHGALLRTRLQLARELNCDLAGATVEPASGSLRNYERAGFRFAYALVGLRRERA